MWRFTVLLALMCSACPARVVVQRAERAIVVDMTSGSPSAEAHVSVETWQVATPPGERCRRKYVFRTKTDAAGRFHVPAESEWLFIVPIPDLPPAFNRRICVAAVGHDAKVADPWATSEPPWNYRFPETYELVPASGRSESARCPF